MGPVGLTAGCTTCNVIWIHHKIKSHSTRVHLNTVFYSIRYTKVWSCLTLQAWNVPHGTHSKMQRKSQFKCIIWILPTNLHTHTHTHTASSEIADIVQVYIFKEGMSSVPHFEKHIHKSMTYMSLQIVLIGMHWRIFSKQIKSLPNTHKKKCNFPGAKCSCIIETREKCMKIKNKTDNTLVVCVKYKAGARKESALFNIEKAKQLVSPNSLPNSTFKAH